ncbi:MAG: hypothetical protein DRP42_05825 [Tenericutes bacterium]|nr:MAG: hypothetical protein DRP42_05825 [Mycoplasmatota bacterium]
MPRAKPAEEVPPEPGGETVFGPTLTQLHLILAPTTIVDENLYEDDNVIRPSSALRIIRQVIKYYLEEEVPQYAKHELAWKETINILGKLEEEAKEDGDGGRSMVLEPFEWLAPDILAMYGRMIAKFNGNYIAYIGNRSSNTFGNLTPAECLKLIYFTLWQFAPTSSWSYGAWKDPHPTIRGMWVTWPWAEYVLGVIRKTYTDMEEMFSFTDPGSSFPWSRPRG